MGFWKDLFGAWSVEPNVRPPPAPRPTPGTWTPPAEAKAAAATIPKTHDVTKAFETIDEALAERLRKVAFVQGEHAVVATYVAPVVFKPVVVEVPLPKLAKAVAAAAKPKPRASRFPTAAKMAKIMTTPKRTNKRSPPKK